MRIERLEDEVKEHLAEIARLRENTVSEEAFNDFVEIVETKYSEEGVMLRPPVHCSSVGPMRDQPR